MLKMDGGIPIRQQLLSEKDWIYSGYSCPCLYNHNSEILVEKTITIGSKETLYSYNLITRKFVKVLDLKSNLSMPSVSNNNSMYAIYSKKSTDWKDDRGSYEIYKFTDSLPLRVIDVSGSPSRVTWSANDSSIFFPMLFKGKTYIVKYNLNTSDINIIALGNQPALSHDGSSIAYIVNNKVKICDTLGHNIKEIVSGHLFVKPFSETSIAWSPNDKYLAFCGELRIDLIFRTWNIYLVPVGKKNDLTNICSDVNPDLDWK